MGFVLAFLSALAAVQQPPPSAAFSESRFHRVHLRNGNFIDGDLFHQSLVEVSLHVPAGTITINRDLVDRVEFIKMRNILEAPVTVVQKPAGLSAPAAAERRDPTERPQPAASAPSRAAPRPYTPSTRVKIKVDVLVVRLSEAAPEDVEAILLEIGNVEGDTTAYVTALMETSAPAVAVALGPILSRRPDRTAIPYLLRLLIHPSGAIRAHAAAGLGACGDAGQIPALAGLVRDPDPGARAAAVTAIADQEEATAFDALVLFISDGDREVRTRALGALTIGAGKFQRASQLAGILSGALARSDPTARVDVLLAIGHSGDPSLSKSVTPFLADTSSALRAAAATALGDLGDASTANAILSRLGGESDEPTRIALAATAVKLKAKEAIPALIAWLQDDSVEIKDAALSALRSISGADFQQDQEKWNEWWEKNKP